MRKITKGLRLPNNAGNSVLRIEVDLQNKIFYFYLSNELISEQRFWDEIPEISPEEKIEDLKKTLEGRKLSTDEFEGRMNIWKTRADKRETFIEEKGLRDEYDEWFWGDFELEERKEGEATVFKGLKPL